MKNQKGFSLIELLIVVVIIGIIAAIAIPNLLASRRAANEGSAIASLRTYHSAQLTYQSTSGAGNYAGDTSNNAFNALRDAGLLDEVLGSGFKSGYLFVGYGIPASNGTASTFYGAAIPASITSGMPMIGFAVYSVSDMMQTGTRYFAVDTEGKLQHDHIGNILNGGMTINADSTGVRVSNGISIEEPVTLNAERDEPIL